MSDGKYVYVLEGKDLDYWVAKAEAKGTSWEDNQNWIEGYLETHSPSCNWNDGGPIIEREGIKVEPLSWRRDKDEVNLWQAGESGCGYDSCGNTFLIAAMRHYVLSKFGDTVY